LMERLHGAVYRKLKWHPACSEQYNAYGIGAALHGFPDPPL